MDSPWMIGIGVSIAVAVFIRFCSKEKLMKITQPSAGFAGVALSFLLLKWLPKKVAEKVEEGILCTLTYVARMWLETFEKKLIEDNTKGKK